MPESGAETLSDRTGWAEQRPETWWMHTKAAILKAHSTGLYNPEEIGAIGIAYQMHGLVIVDRSHRPLRDAIIWRSEEHTSELQSREKLVCRLLLEKKKQ